MDPHINEPRKANALFNELAKAMSEQCIHEPRKAILKKSGKQSTGNKAPSFWH